MSEQDPYRIYVAHLFQESDDYRRVFEYIESNDRFFYRNLSNPNNMPASGGTESIQEELRTQIQAAEIMILPLALHATNPSLVEFQINCAQAADKPILGLQPFGGTVTVEKAVFERCNDVVEWSQRAITNGIKQLARNEDVSDWDSIDFELGD